MAARHTAGLVKLVRISADDHGNGAACFSEPTIGERRAYPRNMLVETPLRDQCRSNQSERHIPDQVLSQHRLGEQSD